MKVLFVSHTALVSGAERSLLEVMASLRGEVEVFLVSPRGDLADRAAAASVKTIELAVPTIGFSSGPRALVSAASGYVRAGLRVRSVAAANDVDIVHAGSPRAGLLTAWCVISRPRRFVDVRDVLPEGVKGSLVRGVLRLSADEIVFNSRFTRDRFGSTAPAKSVVAYPSVDVTRLLELPIPAVADARRPLSLGVVGQITPWKGQDDAIRVLARVRERFPDARLRIIGSVVFTGDGVGFDNERYRADLSLLAADLGVEAAVEFAGQTEDMASALESLDVLLVPSWAEPFGRIVVEGMAAGVPVVATSMGGPAELIDDGESGFLIAPRETSAWAAAVLRLLEDPDLRAVTAERARARVVERLAAERDRAGVVAQYAGVQA